MYLFIFIAIEFIFNVVLVSSVQQSESVICCCYLVTRMYPTLS